MLAGAFEVGERSASGPAAAWFRDALWLAYAASDGTLVVRSVDVLGDPAQGVRRATGRPCGGLTATAVQGDRLYVLYGTPGEEHRLTWTADGVTFAPPAALPIHRGFTGIGGLAAYPGGLAVLWAENAGGQAHLLTSADGGATFDDTLLPFSAAAEPGLCFEGSTGRLLYAFGQRSGGPDSFTLASAHPSTPATLLERETTATPLDARHVV